MKVLVIALCLFSLLSLCAHAQIKRPGWFNGHDTVAYYMVNDKMVSTNDADVQFLRMIIIRTGATLFEIQDWYADDKPRLIAYSSVGTYLFHYGLQGEYKEYYKTGGKKAEKNYVKGEEVGTEITYYPNGALRSSISHDTTGKYLMQFQDSTGRVLTEHGNGRWIKVNEINPAEFLEGPIVNGREDGIWKLNGKDTAVHQVIYAAGRVVQGEEYLKGFQEIFSAVETKPSFPGGDAAFGQFLGKSMHYPTEARDRKLQGRVILAFIVEKDGTLSNFQVVSSPHESLSKEALRVMRGSPPWVPGIKYGKPVSVQYTVPMAFSLVYE